MLSHILSCRVLVSRQCSLGIQKIDRSKPIDEAPMTVDSPPQPGLADASVELTNLGDLGVQAGTERNSNSTSTQSPSLSQDHSSPLDQRGTSLPSRSCHLTRRFAPWSRRPGYPSCPASSQERRSEMSRCWLLAFVCCRVLPTSEQRR
jgi:hypothetical protein